MSVKCAKTFTLKVNAAPPITDMPLDQAVYVPATGLHGEYIAGVRGGYIFKFSATTGSFVSATRFASPVFGNSCITYEPTNDKLCVGCWNEWGYWEGDATLTPTKGLWVINPATFASEFHLVTFLDTDSSFTRFVYGQTDGVVSLSSGGGFVYGFVAPDDSEAPMAFKFNPATHAIAVSCSAGYSSYWGGHVIFPVSSGILVNTNWQDFSIVSAANLNPALSLAAASMAGSGDGWGGGQGTGAQTGIVRACADSSDNVYMVNRSPTLWKLTAGLLSIVALNPGDAAARYFGTSFNAVDGFVYVANPVGNKVVVWNPGTDTLVSTKTGFDSPHGFVFTPTKKFAVQHGLVPLKEIV